MGESATAMGRWRAVGMPASRPTRTGRSGLGYRVSTALGTRLVPTHLPVAHKGSLPDLRISAPSGFACILVCGRATRPIFDHR